MSVFAGNGGLDIRGLHHTLPAPSTLRVNLADPRPAPARPP